MLIIVFTKHIGFAFGILIHLEMNEIEFIIVKEKVRMFEIIIRNDMNLIGRNDSDCHSYNFV